MTFSYKTLLAKLRALPAKSLLLISGLFLFVLLFFAASPRHRLHCFMMQIFRSEMSADTLNMHYTLAHPEHYGISPKKSSLPVYSAAQSARTSQDCRKAQKTLHTIPKAFLSADDRLLYRLLERQLTEQIEAEKYPYYSEPLSPASGAQSQLPILLSEYTFRSVQDVEVYLSLLTKLPAYFDGLLQYEQEKADAGFFMPDDSADKLLEQCELIMDESSLKAGTHFLELTFKQRLDLLTAKGLLTQKEADAFAGQNQEILLSCVLPAYQRLGDGILLLKGKGKNPLGLCHFPEGRDYYCLLFRQTTGCERPIPEVKQMLLSQLKADTQALSTLLKEHAVFLTGNDGALLLTDKLQEIPCFSTPDTMLCSLTEHMARDFPTLPPSKEAIMHQVKNVSECMEDYSSPAFYLTPPVDDCFQNTIYINQKDAPDALELYTTLAHEGYPGHLYQTVYYQLCCQKEKTPPLRSLLSCGGYVEGWALYVEMQSYQYVQEILSENGVSDDLLLSCEAQRLSRSIQLCLCTLLDIAIHYEGADYETVCEILSKFGIANENSARAMYAYIREEPANYPKYYVGYLEFLALKNTLKERLGEDFSEKTFHESILKTGPAPFSILTEYLLAAS